MVGMSAGDANLRVTVRGLLVATGIAAIFVMACMVPLEGQGIGGITALYAARLTSFFAALAAPFERALAGMCVGLGFFLGWLVLSLLVWLAVP